MSMLPVEPEPPAIARHTIAAASARHRALAAHSGSSNLLLSTLFVAAFAMPARGQLFRHDGSGAYPSANPPMHWNAEKPTDFLWHVEVGKSAFSSPLLVKDRVLVMSDPAALVCVDASSGKVLWQRNNTFADLVPPKPAQPVKGEAGNTAASLISDGRRVWAAFGSGIVACYDLVGERKWIRHISLPPAQAHGRSASPVLVGRRLVLSVKHLLAVDPMTGADIWAAKGVPESYGTPSRARIGDTDVLVTPNGCILRASDGAVLAKDLASVTYTSPLVVGNIVYFIDGTSVAVQLPEVCSDKLQTKTMWEQDLEGEFFASPIHHDGLLYAVNNGGKYYVLDPKSGQVLLEQDLEIPNASGKPGQPEAHMYPSPCLAGGRIYLGNDGGDMLVLAPGKSYKELARNRLAAGSGGTPTFSNTCLFIRGGSRLYCIGKR